MTRSTKKSIERTATDIRLILRLWCGTGIIIICCVSQTDTMIAISYNKDKSKTRSLSMRACFFVIEVYSRAFFVSVGNIRQSRILPSVETVTTCQGINFPLFCKAVLAAFSSPPQQGTSIRTTVTLLMSLLPIIAASFSE